MTDITSDVLRGPSVSISRLVAVDPRVSSPSDRRRKREPTASDSETESPKRPRAAPSALQRLPTRPNPVKRTGANNAN
jgi:hypothetical protein